MEISPELVLQSIFISAVFLWSISIPKLLAYSLYLANEVKVSKKAGKILEKEIKQGMITKEIYNEKRADLLSLRMDRIEKNFEPMRDPVIEAATAIILIMVFMFLPSGVSQEATSIIVADLAILLSATMLVIALVLRNIGIKQWEKDKDELLRIQSKIT